MKKILFILALLLSYTACQIIRIETSYPEEAMSTLLSPKKAALERRIEKSDIFIEGEFNRKDYILRWL